VATYETKKLNTLYPLVRIPLNTSTKFVPRKLQSKKSMDGFMPAECESEVASNGEVILCVAFRKTVA